MEIDTLTSEVPGGVAATVRVRLSGRESGRLFLSGDTLIDLPLDGALPEAGGAPVARPGMFLSELAGEADGVTRVFADEAHALAFVGAVRAQLERALETP